MQTLVLMVNTNGFELFDILDYPNPGAIVKYSGSLSIGDFKYNIKPVLEQYKDSDITVVNNGIKGSQLQDVFFELGYTLYPNGQLEKVVEGSIAYSKWLCCELDKAGFKWEWDGDHIKVTGKKVL